MEDETVAVDDLPLLEETDVPALDERLIADEESRRDSRDTPLRQTPVIQSIHCGCYLGRMIDVKVVARKLWNAVFDPKRSQHGVLVALRHPRVSVCVFPSGKVISMGAKSEASAIVACRKVARMIQRLAGYDSVRVTDFKVHNVTASGALGYRIDLRALARHPAHEEFVEYNPDQFPGLHYKLLDARSSAPTHSPPSTVKAEQLSTAVSSTSASVATRPATSSLTLTLYFSGRFTLVGAQHELDVYTHFEQISRSLFPFSHIHTRQAQQSAAAGAVDSKQWMAYEQWLEASTREEGMKGGRMGWEEEADRVRHEMAKRERKRTTQLRDAMRTTQQQQQQQPVGTGGEVRVKAEPGTVAVSHVKLHDEMKEASAVIVETVASRVELSQAPPSEEVILAARVDREKAVVDERKDTEDGMSELSAVSDSALVVASQNVEEEESAEVEWE